MFVHVYIHHFDKLTATGAVSVREEGGGGGGGEEGGEGRRGRETVAHARVHTCSKPCTDQSYPRSQALPKNGGGEPGIDSHVISRHDAVALTIK